VLVAALLSSAAFALVTLAACGDDEVVRAGPDASPLDGSMADGALDAPDAAPMPPVPKGGRVLGVSVDLADLDFAQDLAVVRDAGAQATSITLSWNDLEAPYDAGSGGSDAGATAISDPSLHVANLVLGGSRSRALVSLAALDQGGPRLPVDLVGKPLDDPEVVTRYERAVDYVLAQLFETEIVALLVGTAADVTLADDPTRNAAFAAFVAQVGQHARLARPGLPVGFEVTPAGMTTRSASLQAAWAASDVVATSLLGVDGAARVVPASSVGAVLDGIIAAAPAGKPVILRETGAPVDPACGGDEASQAAFLTALFEAWDRHATRIPFACVRDLDDARPAAVTAEAARWGRTDPAFVALLGSLGLRRSGGAERPGLEALRREARRRGW